MAKHDGSEKHRSGNPPVWRRRIAWAAWLLGVGVLVAASLFLSNGASEGWKRGELIVLDGTSAAMPVAHDDGGRNVSFLVWNLAKCGFHEGGVRFRDAGQVEDLLDVMGAVIRAADADVVLLSEVVFEFAVGPRNIHQARYLAEACGYPYVATGDNYSFGLPVLRIRSGNAVLSRFPLSDPKVIQLHGAKPFWRPTNNRRALLCDAEIFGRTVRLCSLRNDSYDLRNNRVQLQQLLGLLRDRKEVVLGGDFNAEPDSPQIRDLRQSGRFCGTGDDRPTHPSHAPKRRIDDIYAPAHWTPVGAQVLGSWASDHLPVRAVFRIPW